MKAISQNGFPTQFKQNLWGHLKMDLVSGAGAAVPRRPRDAARGEGAVDGDAARHPAHPLQRVLQLESAQGEDAHRLH